MLASFQSLSVCEVGLSKKIVENDDEGKKWAF
jgi:hypothetical protein